MITKEKSKLENFDTIYQALWSEMLSFCTVFQEYCELFDSKQSRVDLMNNTAPAFFSMIQQALLSQLLLGMSHLVAPLTSGRQKQDNLTLKRLLPLIPDENRKLKIEVLIAEAEEKIRFADPWRHKWIAHRDLKVVLNDKGATKLPIIDRSKVETALKALSKVFSAVSNTHVAFNQIPILNGYIKLLRLLDMGHKEHLKKMERLKNGNLIPSDLERVEI